MPVGMASLSMQLRQLVEGAYPSWGQTKFVVDSDFRTQAQGWSRADGTGPLDLIEERRPGKGGITSVFRTADYASDSACLQAAHDAAIAFNGDTIFFTPGALSLATAVNITSESLRLLGPIVNSPMQARVTITAAVANALSIAATCDDMELAFLKLIPLTNASVAVVSGACNRGFWHDFTWDANGVVTSTATSCVNFTGAALDWQIVNCVLLTDDAQAAPFIANGNVQRMRINGFTHLHSGGTQAIGLLQIVGGVSFGFDIGPGLGIASGVTAAVTTLVDVADQTTATTHGAVHDFLGIGYATATTLVTLAGTTAEWTLARNIFGTTDAAATTTALMNTGSLYTS